MRAATTTGGPYGISTTTPAYWRSPMSILSVDALGTRSAVLAGLAAALLAANTASAAPLLLTTVDLSIDSSFSTGQLCGDGGTDGDTVSASCSDSFYVDISGIQTRIAMDSFGSARASYGSLGVTAEVIAQITDNPGGGQVDARALADARMYDTFLVQGASSGTLQFVFSVEGSENISATGNGGWTASVGGVLVNLLNGASFSDPGIVLVDVPFGTGATPVAFALRASVS